MQVVVMGVSASGKSLVGKALAERLQVPFRDGDDFHPNENIRKMRAGIALDDSDRAPWLDAIVGWLAAHKGSGGVVSCSALKQAYRDRLRGTDARLQFVFLAVDAATLRERIAERQDHFMSANLLQSQLDTLEPPGPDEPDVIVIGGTIEPATIVATVARQLTIANGQP